MRLVSISVSSCINAWKDKLTRAKLERTKVKQPLLLEKNAQSLSEKKKSPPDVSLLIEFLEEADSLAEGALQKKIVSDVVQQFITFYNWAVKGEK